MRSITKQLCDLAICFASFNFVASEWRATMLSLSYVHATRTSSVFQCFAVDTALTFGCHYVKELAHDWGSRSIGVRPTVLHPSPYGPIRSGRIAARIQNNLRGRNKGCVSVVFGNSGATVIVSRVGVVLNVRRRSVANFNARCLMHYHNLNSATSYFVFGRMIECESFHMMPTLFVAVDAAHLRQLRSVRND